MRYKNLGASGLVVARYDSPEWSLHLAVILLRLMLRHLACVRRCVTVADATADDVPTQAMAPNGNSATHVSW